MSYPKFVSETFDEVAESDFNPDIVLEGMRDCYDCAISRGFVVGIVTGGIIALINKWIIKKED